MKTIGETGSGSGRKISHILVGTLLLGSIWGLSEVALGGSLQAVRQQKWNEQGYLFGAMVPH